MSGFAKEFKSNHARFVRRASSVSCFRHHYAIEASSYTSVLGCLFGEQLEVVAAFYPVLPRKADLEVAAAMKIQHSGCFARRLLMRGPSFGLLINVWRSSDGAYAGSVDLQTSISWMSWELTCKNAHEDCGTREIRFLTCRNVVC